MLLNYIHRGKLSAGIERLVIENDMRWRYGQCSVLSAKKYNERWVILVYLR